MRDKIREYLKLYVITDSHLVNEVKGAEEALKGGATAIQLRMKKVSPREIFEKAQKIRKLCEDYSAMFIVNDYVDIAYLSAHGVHLGSEDLPVKEVRKGYPHLVIGASAKSSKYARQCESDGADYLGVGAVFPTKTKKTKIIGVAGLREIVKSVNIPVVAIGGINHSNVVEVLETGVSGIAVVSAIMGSKHIEKATRELRKIVDEYL